MWDKLTNIKKLGEGGMGDVWLAYHSELGAQFAVKTLRPDLVRPKDVERFDRELRYLLQLRHPNIVRVVDFSSDPKRPGYAMELCPGGPIDQHMESEASQRKVMDRFWEALSGLEYLHTRTPAIVHRDLKPSNMLVGADGKLKISDLGLSRSLETARVTGTSSNWVSPGFSPPEQWEDFASVDQRGDLFSLGATFFYLLTKRTYKTTETFEDIESFAVQAILRKLLAIQRNDRVPSAVEVRNCWKLLTERTEPEEYLQLSRIDRRAKLEAVSHVYVGMPEGDLEAVLGALVFLEAVLPLEPDADIRVEAERLLAFVEGQMKIIAAEMEQDNPSF